MKREITLAILSIMFLSFIASAAQSDIIADKIGIDTDDIPQNTEQIKEQYLKQNWEEIITNNAILGKIHLFFMKISPLFDVLFGQPYSLSPRLLFVILLWIYVVTKIDSLLSAIGILNKPTNALIGIAGGIIIAQLNILSAIINSLATLAFSPESWVMRIIAIIISATVIFIMHIVINKGIYSLKSKRLNESKSRNEHIGKQMMEFIKGIKEGQSLTKN